MPAGAVYVGRPSMWGNPFLDLPGGCTCTVHFALPMVGTAAAAYRLWLQGKLIQAQAEPYYRDLRAKILERLPELRGRDLACWCRLDEPCHADVLLELANPPKG